MDTLQDFQLNYKHVTILALATEGKKERFYFAQLFVLFSAQSTIFFAHFQQKLLLIHWLQVMRTS